MSIVHRVSKQVVNITPRQYEILTILKQRHQWSVSDVADELGVSCAAATKAITRLERKGLVARAIDPMDRRRVNVHVTTPGTEFIASEK